MNKQLLNSGSPNWIGRTAFSWANDRRRFAWVRRNGLAYLATLAALLACLGARIALEPLAGDRSVLVILIPAVLVGAALGGFGAALFAVLFSLVATELLIGLSMVTDPTNLVTVVVFLLIGAFGGLAGDRVRQARQDRAETVAGLRALLDTVPDAMFVFDVRGMIHSFSASAVRTFGWSVEEVTDRPVWMLFPSSSEGPIRACLQVVEASGEPDGFGGRRVLQGRRRDETEFTMELFVSPKGSAGNRMFTGFARDLTGRLAEQERLRVLEADLMHVSRLNAMGQMATTLAHELNQPLAAAANFMAASERMLQQPAPNIQLITEAIRNGTEQTMRAGDIIQRLRTFIAKQEPHRSREDLAVVLMEATALAMAGDHEITVGFDIEPGLTPVRIDRVQIQQVVVNLVRNAREAMSGVEQRSLAIGARRVGTLVEISVADTGTGVDP